MRTMCLTILLLLAWPAAADFLSPAEARARAADGQLTIIDVRLPMEWAETGLPAGAVGVSLQDAQTLEPRSGFVADVLRALGGERNQPIALICARGNRSAFARDLLAQAGFTDVHDISDGVLGGPNGPGWLQRELPTEPCKVC
jgi:rhodanese-related sulfurtransferase